MTNINDEFEFSTEETGDRELLKEMLETETDGAEINAIKYALGHAVTLEVAKAYLA